MFIILQGEMREKGESNRFYVKDGGPSLIGFLCDVLVELPGNVEAIFIS